MSNRYYLGIAVASWIWLFMFGIVDAIYFAFNEIDVNNILFFMIPLIICLGIAIIYTNKYSQSQANGKVSEVQE